MLLPDWNRRPEEGIICVPGLEDIIETVELALLTGNRGLI
jgi:hypothetical protein